MALLSSAEAAYRVMSQGTGITPGQEQTGATGARQADRNRWYGAKSSRQG